MLIQRSFHLGFHVGQNALEMFTVHERSHSHKTAVTTHICEDGSVQVQLSSVSVKQREEARGRPLKVIGAVQMLARQGLPFRGRDCGEGTFEQVLKYKSEDEPSLVVERRIYTLQLWFRMKS